ncbi:MAG: ATP synthase F1 subunit delta [Crocinitomicaceae bacterium]|nr:ATP synthase F1 subunit delta [Crocinitomicaceae bacterium]
MKGNKVASRYAKALLDLAVEKNSLDQVNNDMLHVAQVLDESKDLSAVLGSPVISPDKKATILDAVFEKNISPMSIGFLRLIVKKTRAGILTEIADSFISHYKKHNNILDVYLTSAVALDNSVKEKVLIKVKAKHTGQVNLIEKIDTTLIGGFVVRMDDAQLDASIANQLTNLKNLLLN